MATAISTTSSLSSILRNHQLLTPSKFKFTPLTSSSPSPFPLHCPKSISIFTRSNFSPIPKSLADDITSPSSPTSTYPLSSYKNLKSRLQNGETLYGLFFLTFSPTVAEIAGLAGYDFVVVDMEHGHGGISDALPCLHALAAAGTAAILRVPETSPAWAKKALDLGPQGIMFPMIDSAKDAKEAVSYCRFPPAGIRGSAHPIVRASGYGIDDGYLNSYLDELLIMCQIESEKGVKKAGEIAAVDGVDCIQMGPLDLSASLGYLWDPGNKKVKEALRAAEKAVLESRKDSNGGGGAYLSGFAMPHDPPLDLASRGYHMVSGATDVGLFRSVVVEDVKRFKASLMEEISDDERRDENDCDEKYWSE
ncbi:hypothetical protein QN277_004713 [Acacia crassicarpa]|uniref:HpcH/HpaI aldolase/citrate lyase domain-containing protein n=1 Tax=Acacia crassicarpa TaxID=499986 RepID=A0AAE1MC41_9FABA|nr:hypothetical protein QN277_004713 [Acacia crassicarpa]